MKLNVITMTPHTSEREKVRVKRKRERERGRETVKRERGGEGGREGRRDTHFVLTSLNLNFKCIHPNT